MSGVREIREVQLAREEQVAHWLTLMAVALFVLSSAVLALGAQAYGWAAALFAAAVAVALTTGTLGRAPRRSTAPIRPAQDGTRRRPARIGEAVDALR